MRGLHRIPFAVWVAIYLVSLAIIWHFVLSAPWLSSLGAVVIVYAALTLYWTWERKGRRPAQRSAQRVANSGKHRAREVGTADHQVG